MAFPLADFLPSPVANLQIILSVQGKPRLMIIPLYGSRIIHPTCQQVQLHFHQQSPVASSPAHHAASLASIVAGSRNRQMDRWTERPGLIPVSGMQHTELCTHMHPEESSQEEKSLKLSQQEEKTNCAEWVQGMT